MAPVNTNFSDTFRYRANVFDLANKSIESSEFRLSDVNWRIKLCRKKTAECTDVLAVHLISSVDDKLEKWSCEAKAMFKLLPKDEQKDKAIVKYLVERKFDSNNLSDGFNEFISWEDFLDKYVSGTEAVFEIKVSTNPIMRTIPSDLDRTQTTLDVSIEKNSELKECYSPEVIVRNQKWKLLFKLLGAENKKCLSVYLYCDKSNMDKNWSYKVNATLKLHSFDKNIQPIIKSLCSGYCFNSVVNNWGCSEFLKWSELTDTKKRYVVYDTANFELEMSVDEPTPLWEINEIKMNPGNSSLQCSICLELLSTGQICSTRCGHLFCAPCFTKSTEVNQICPMCKKPANSEELHPIYFT